MEIKTVSVSQTNAYIKKLIDSNSVISNFWVRGEISNFKHHPSGHMYITLKDENSTLKAVMFKGNTFSLKFTPKDGMMVMARGRISVYEAAGTYQFYVEEMLESGIGDLQVKFEKLKEKLKAEGLFDESHKKPIPRYPSTIGVCTAVSGAAVRDIINVISRRYPLSEIVIYPTIVQGAEAADSISDAIKWFNDNNEADVLIVGRGGGSIEDLWAFNEEKVAYSIFNSKIPIISAVGHETDFTIADFVSDLRAPTPSAAAELAVPSKDEIFSYLMTTDKKLLRIIKDKTEKLNLLLDKFTPDFPKNLVNSKIAELNLLSNKIEMALKNKCLESESKFKTIVSALNALSPLNVLSRGYTVTTKDNKTVKSATELKTNDTVNIKFIDGKIDCIVK